LRLALLSCALAFAAWPQTHLPRLQLESTQRFAPAQPQGDEAGSRWAWRSEKEILLSPPATKISGAFLQHQWSANGEALLALEKPNAKREREDEAGLALRWFDARGQELGAHVLPWHEDDPLPRMILNRGGSHALALEPASGRVTFFAGGGRVVRESFLFENAPYTNERPAFLAASEEHFYVLSQAAPSTPEQAHAVVLICYATNGNEQWRRELPQGTAAYLALSPSGKRLAANQYAFAHGRVAAASLIFEANGQQRATFSGMLREASFSNEEQLLFALDRRELRCVETVSGKILWQHQLKRRDEMFVTAKALPNSSFVIALVGASAWEQNRFVYQQNRLLLFDQAGRQQSESAVADALVKPTLVISSSEQKLRLAAEGILLQYNLIASAHVK
jgi:hypothetical protein